MRKPIIWLLTLLLLLTPNTVRAADAPLYEGLSGSAVTELQMALKELGYFSVEPTGYFGTITKEALQRWQRDNALSTTGTLTASERDILYATAAKTALLSEGMSGSQVSTLQRYLSNLGYFKEEITGYFGPITKTALKNWQKDHEFSQTGYLSTWEWQMVSQDSASKKLSYTDSEFDLFVRLIEAEAGGESYLGKLAVAAVVVNRALSGKYPGTISGVIYERYQFEPVSNGYINRVTPSADSYRAAQAALNGEDPTSGALFFHNPDLSTSVWMHNRPVLLRIGRHVFS